MQFIKSHWFGLLTAILIFCFLVLFILVLLSPRQDARKRGFIPCTEAMAAQMMDCSNEKSHTCMLKSILGNSWCQIKVIGYGFKQWLKKEQPLPWSNYIFIPEQTELDENFDETARQEYFENNPDAVAEMLELKQLNEELENEQDRQQYDPSEQPQ